MHLVSKRVICFFSTENAVAGYKFYAGPSVVTSISGGGDITANGAITSASSSTTGNATVGGNLTVTGTLITTGFYSMKPYIASYLSSAGVVSTTIKQGFATITSVSKSTGQYVCTIPAHPSGANYAVFVQQQFANSSTAIANYGVLVTSSTVFSVYSKTTGGVLVDSAFYVRTVPQINYVLLIDALLR